MKTVLLLLGTDRFSFPLIRYLILEGRTFGWKLCVGSLQNHILFDRMKEQRYKGDLIHINIPDFKACHQAIRKADIVIAMVSDRLLLQVADSCIAHGKPLIAPNRLNRHIALRKLQAEKDGVLMLLECGFSPGLDHITARKAIDNIHAKGGRISLFTSCSGSLICEEYVDNPWGFKLTEPIQDVINLGKNVNRHLIHSRLQHISYHNLFERGQGIAIKGLEDVVVIPEGDSLYYRNIYGLPEASTVCKGKIIRRGFERTWNLLVKLGLTDTTTRLDLLDKKTFYDFLDSFTPYSPMESLELKLRKYFGAGSDDIERMKWIGLFDDEWFDASVKSKDVTSAMVLQYLLEKHLSMEPYDKDCIVMQHHMVYDYQGLRRKLTATLVAKGESLQDSATAKAIGLPLGVAAKAVLLGYVQAKGLRIPTEKEIYEPLLNELADLGVAFHIDEEIDEEMFLREVEVNDQRTIKEDQI